VERGKLRVMNDLSGKELWQAKRDWYERTHSPEGQARIDEHMIQAGAYVRHPIEGEVLEGLDSGRLSVGEGSHFEPGCWLTLAPEARITIGRDCYLNRNVMLAAMELIEIGDHTMLANGCFVGDSDHRYDDRSKPITEQGFIARGPVRIGANCWFGANCVVTGGVEIGERCVIGANSVVTKSLPPGVIAAGSPAKVIREIEWQDETQKSDEGEGK
jgi:acetyltransferase-like isoleucine patch superfamily enzyme